MYLTDFKIFRQFLMNKNMDVDTVPACNNIPAIVIYKRGEVLLAKVEVTDYAAFQFQLRNPKSQSDNTNKYWIRGQEWPVENGKPVQKMVV